MTKNLLGAIVLKRARAVVLVGIAVSAVVASAAIVLPVAPALADPTPPAATATPQAQWQRLERIYQREQTVLTNEQKRLDQAGQLVTKIQNRINTLNSEGKDTSKLEEALADLNANIASAQSFHDTAKSILDTHAGFDGSGQVTDVAQARETVKTAGKAELSFTKTVRQTVRELRQDRKAARKTNSAGSQPNTQPTNPPATQ